MRPTPDETLLRLLRRMPPAEAQNGLMRIADREIALAMTYLTDRDRQFVLSLIARTKAVRIQEEFGFRRHLRVHYEHYRTAIENVIRQLENQAPAAPLKSYVRPRSRRRR